MTGENWGMGPDPDDSKGYASAGGFDSMINFAFNPKSACTEPDENDFEQYGGYFERAPARRGSTRSPTSPPTIPRSAGRMT